MVTLSTRSEQGLVAQIIRRRSQPPAVHALHNLCSLCMFTVVKALRSALWLALQGLVSNTCLLLHAIAGLNVPLAQPWASQHLPVLPVSSAVHTSCRLATWQ